MIRKHPGTLTHTYTMLLRKLNGDIKVRGMKGESQKMRLINLKTKMIGKISMHR